MTSKEIGNSGDLLRRFEIQCEINDIVENNPRSGRMLYISQRPLQTAPSSSSSHLLLLSIVYFSLV